MKINNKQIKSLFLLSLVGAGAGKENNQSEITHSNGINVNSLPEMASNLTERQNSPEQRLLFFAGYPISLGAEKTDGSEQKWRKYSTASFVVVNTNSSTCLDGNDYGGFLTSSFGWPPQWFWGGGYVELSEGVYDWNGLTILGDFFSDRYTNFLAGNAHQDTDYTYVSNAAGIFNSTWNTELTPYVVGGSDDGSLQLYPVTGLGSVVIGSKVCAYGAVSGYNCGNITEINVGLAIPNPGDASNFLTMAGLGKVDLGINGFYGEGDLGGPVYVESNIGDRTTAQALGHITHFDNIDPNHKLLYYTPIDKAFEGILDNESNCSYALMTYNETHAEKHQELLAQIELPVKK